MFVARVSKTLRFPIYRDGTVVMYVRSTRVTQLVQHFIYNILMNLKFMQTMIELISTVQ